MDLYTQLEIVEACKAWTWIQEINDPNIRSKVVRMIVRTINKLDRKEIMESKMDEEVKVALIDFQIKLDEIQNKALLSKYKYV